MKSIKKQSRVNYKQFIRKAYKIINFVILIILFNSNTIFGGIIEQGPANTLPLQSGTKLVASDIDLDGDLDLILLGNSDPGSVYFFENRGGTYTLLSMWDFGDSSATYNAIYSGDINNDGFPDLVLNKKNDSIRVVLNNYGGFNEYDVSWEYTNNNQVQDVLLADFNNDGNLDLAVANYSNNTWIFKGNGDGTFSSIPDLGIPGSMNFTVAISAADMNNDGNIDLICANYGANKTNMIYLLDGNFGIVANNKLPENGSSPYAKSIAIGDVNNDGYFDVLVGCADSGGNNSAVQILTNNGTGQCSEKVVRDIVDDQGPVTGSPVNMDVADINADGILDFLVTIENQGPYVYIGSNTGNYGLDSHPAGNIYAIFCDYDNDTDLDVVFAHIHNNKSKIISDTSENIPSSIGVTRALKFGDQYVLLQTDTEIIIGQPNLWGGTANWYGPYTNYFVGRKIESVAVGDVNGVLSFSDVDDYIVGTSDGWIYVYTNASLQWHSQTNFNLFWSNKVDTLIGENGYYARVMALGDVNGDGAPDLVFQSFPTNSWSADTNSYCWIALNSGNNGFSTNLIKIPSMKFNGESLMVDVNYILIADIDNDGDNDILAASGGPDWIVYNKGQGVFDEATSQYPELMDTRVLALGDVDGDGDLDLFRGNESGPVEYSYGYENVNGVFSADTIWQSPTLYAASAMLFDDVDKDGDVDLCFANNIEVEESFIMENKNGQLGTTKDDYLWSSSDPNGPPGENMKFSGIIVRDMDDDNDDDVFLIASQPNQTNKIFKGMYNENFQVQASNLPNVPSYAKWKWGLEGTPTNFTAVPINIIGYDGDKTNTLNADTLIRIQISLNNGATWADATMSKDSGWISDGPLSSSFFIKSSRQGSTNKFFWNSIADSIQGTGFVIKIVTYPNYRRSGKVHHSAYVDYEKAPFYLNGYPNAFISSPADAGNVMGTVKIIGAAYDYDFTKYVLTIKNDLEDKTFLTYTNTTPVPPAGTLYSWNTTTVSTGAYNIFLDVYDTLGQKKSADTIHINVVKANSDSPSVSAVYPKDGAEDVAANSPVIAQFSRYMNVNTMRDDTMQVSYNEQEELTGNAKYKNLVKALIFDADPNLMFNASHIGIVDGDFKDVLGNKIGNDYMWNFKAAKFLPSTIDKGYPTGEDVETNTLIKVYYNVDMSGFTNFNDDTFYVQDINGNKVNGRVAYNPTNNITVFNPTNGLSGSTIYIVTIKKDIVNEAVPSPYSWYFITKDTVKPQVVSTTPTSGEDFFNPLSEIKITFNKTMNINQLQTDIFELKQGNTVIDGSLTYDMENNILIFKPETELTGLSKYTATVFSKFEDMGGQEIGSDYQWSFRTTKILSSSGGSISSSDNKVKIRMPKNAVTSSIALSITKLSESEIPTPKNDKIKTIGVAYKFYPEGTQFNKPLTIQLTYPDDNNNGLVDSSTTGMDLSPTVDEKKLAIFYYNESKGEYERIGGTVDAENNTITAAIRHFSIFGIFEDLNSYSDDLAITEINTYPRIFNPKTDDYIDINFNVKLKSSATASIKVYNLSGRLVKNIVTDMDINYGINYVQWDGKDNDNDIVHNRMYVLLIMAEDSNGNKVRKTKTIVVEE